MQTRMPCALVDVCMFELPAVPLFSALLASVSYLPHNPNLCFHVYFLACIHMFAGLKRMGVYSRHKVRGCFPDLCSRIECCCGRGLGLRVLGQLCRGLGSGHDKISGCGIWLWLKPQTLHKSHSDQRLDIQETAVRYGCRIFPPVNRHTNVRVRDSEHDPLTFFGLVILAP